MTLLAHTSFRCLLCGSDAGHVSVVEESASVVVDRVGGRIAVPAAQRPALLRAVHDGNVDAIFRLDLEYTPSYCPTCGACYCSAHWRRLTEFEEDGWYDCVRGTCPNGHTRMLED